MSFYWSYLLEKMAQLDPDILYKLYPAYLQQISDKMSRKRVKGGVHSINLGKWSSTSGSG